MIKSLIKKFGFTAYTWNGSYNGWKGKGYIKKIEGLDNQVQKIEVGPKHSAVVTDNGELYIWGDNQYGKLGLGKESPKQIDIPTKIPFFKENNIKVKDVVLEAHHTIVLDTNGKVYSFGRGSFYSNPIIKFLFAKYLALGHPEAKNVHTPKLIEKFKNKKVKLISTGKQFATSVLEDESYNVWGRGEFGVFGFENKEVAEPIENPLMNEILKETNTTITKILSCNDFTTALFSDGIVRSFGNNNQGNMGLGELLGFDLYEAINIPTPVEWINKAKVVTDFDISEKTMVLKDTEGKLYISGMKVYFHPTLVPLEYDKHNVRTFCATEKGMVLITEENKCFGIGKVWDNKDIDDNLETGLWEAQIDKYFEGRSIMKMGGNYSGCYALVD